MEVLPPLRARKSPLLACLIGFATSGIGLVFYFRSLVDLVVSLGMAAATFWVLGSSEFFAGMLIGGLYGCLRALSSNRRRSGKEESGR